MKAKEFVANYVSLFLLLTLTADSLASSWWQGPLYARIELNLFYRSHALSILPFCLAAFYLWLYKKDGLTTAVFAALSTASIHEILLDVNDEIYFGVSSGISLSYAIILAAILLVGLWKGKRYHRVVLVAMSVLMTIWFATIGLIDYSGFVIGSTIDPNVPFGQSQYFFNPLTNFAEIASWIVPASLWFLPRQWFASPQSSQPSGDLLWQQQEKPSKSRP